MKSYILWVLWGAVGIAIIVVYFKIDFKKIVINFFPISVNQTSQQTQIIDSDTNKSISTRGAGVKKNTASKQGASEQSTITPVSPSLPQSQIDTQSEIIPLELYVNLIGQRETSSDNFEEIIIRDGSTLHSGDNFQIHLKTSRDCYVYVLLFDSKGKASMLFPGIAGSDNRVNGNRDYQIPSGNEWFYLDENTGTETIYVLTDVNPMSDIDRLLSDMERKGNAQQREDSQKILAQVNVLKRGVGGITKGKTLTFKTSDGDTISNVTDVVKGRGSLVWTVSFKHI